MKKAVLLFISILCFLYSCNQKQILSIEDYVKWIDNEENVLHVKKTIGEFYVDVQYMTPDYCTAKEMGLENARNQDSFKVVRSQKEDLQTILLTIGSPQNKDGDLLQFISASKQTTFNQLVQYFSFAIKDDISLVCDKDTLPCVLHVFERNYGLAPTISIVCSFEKSKRITDKTFIFQDKALGIGIVKINFKESDFKNIPTIKW
jgi:hypothetical protein